jgi:hypothetical protein
MRRGWKMIALALVLLMVLVVVAYAARGGGRMGRGVMGGGRGGGGRMGPGAGAGMGRGMMAQCPFHTMMGQRIMVAAPDGVYVMIGDELLKYDQELRLQKEAEIKIDWTKMATRMLEMHRNCPICQQMMPQMPQEMPGGGRAKPE